MWAIGEENYLKHTHLINDLWCIYFIITRERVRTKFVDPFCRNCKKMMHKNHNFWDDQSCLTILKWWQFISFDSLINILKAWRFSSVTMRRRKGKDNKVTQKWKVEIQFHHFVICSSNRWKFSCFTSIRLMTFPNSKYWVEATNCDDCRCE